MRLANGVYPTFGELDDGGKRLVAAVARHLREHGEWPGVPWLAADLGVEESTVHRIVRDVGGDIVVVTGVRVGLTLKGLLILPDADSERAVTQRWLEALRSRRLANPDARHWMLSDLHVSARPASVAAVHLTLIRSEEGGPNYPVAESAFLRAGHEPNTYRSDCLEAYYAATIPAHQSVIGAEVDAIALHADAMLVSGRLDRRRVASLAAEALERNSRAGAAERESASRLLAWARSHRHDVDVAAELQLLRGAAPSIAEVTLTVGEHRVTATAGTTTRTVDYHGLDLGKRAPTKPWMVLQLIALGGALVPPKAARSKARLGKHVQKLNAELARWLGVRAEPSSRQSGGQFIAHRDGAYRPIAKIHADDDLKEMSLEDDASWVERVRRDLGIR